MSNLTVLIAATLILSQAPQDAAKDALASARADARARYEKVEAELARASLEALSPAQREARARLMEVLDAYVQRGDFGLQGEAPGVRVPLFVDDDGRRCAMAELLHATGENELVESVATKLNTAWIANLSEDAIFLGWLDRNGLSLEEAARIQGPALPPPSRAGSEAPPTSGGPGVPGFPGGTAGGDPAPSAPSTPAPSLPGDTIPNGPSSPGPAAPGSPGPSGPAFPTSPGGTPSIGAPSSPGPVGPLSEADAGWRTWWEYNKIQFLRPNRFELASANDDSAGRTFTSQLNFMRRAMFPVLSRGLEHPDARIRAAAAGAFGRMGGSEAVEPLMPLLRDSHEDVRDATLLGLGASGAAEAQPVLVQIAKTGKIGQAREFGRRGRALAIVALGLGRRVGFDASTDDTVIDIAERCSPVERSELGVAAMTYALLNPSDKLTALAYEFAHDKSQPLTVRCRAAEALRGRTDADTLAALQHLASGTRVEVRRSAALALGEFRHPLVVAGLMTAQDLEKEPVASSYMLVSLGRRGGDKAREHLIGALTGKDSIDRPWAALGLGMLAREHGDAAAVKALKSALAEEKNADNRGAFWLALGLTRDASAFKTLSAALHESADAGSRMYAAQALAMLGGESARQSLLSRLAVERSSLTRSQIALALGVIGAPEDLDVIASTMTSVAEPMLQGQVASAIAFHGSSDALAKLGSMLADSKLPSATRAASFDGLGMMLSLGAPLSLGESARSGNYVQFPEWLLKAYSTTF